VGSPSRFGETTVKTPLVGAGVALAVLAAVGAGYVLEKRHAARDIEGSPTVEFAATEREPEVVTAPKPTRTPGRIVWPVFGYDPERRKSPEVFEQRPPYRLIWAFRAQSLLEFPPVIAYRRAYIAGLRGGLFALDVRTGRVAWRYRSGRCSAASSAVAGELVYHAFMNRPPCDPATGRQEVTGQVVALDARTGTVRWRTRIGATESPPAIVHGLVYVGDWRGRIYALDARTGRIRWTFSTRGEVKAGVAISGGKLFVGSYDGHMYALDARNGRLLWRSAAQDRLGGLGAFYATPAVAYGRVYVANTDGKIYSYGARTGRIRWSHSTGGYAYSSPAIWRMRVYAGSHDRRLYCFDAATGRVLWSFRANGWVAGAPTVINGLVYFSTATGRTYALDARTGKQHWIWRDGQYTAVAADRRRLYVVGYAKLYAMVRR
jgi:outer membrane protein assembly factor BamB